MATYTYPAMQVYVAPSPIAYNVDGVATTVNKDTVTKANTRAMPVEIVAVDGTALNIVVTTGDVNVQLDHVTISGKYDSVRIGDGVTELGIKPVTKEALVIDSGVIAAVGTLNTSVSTLLKPADTLAKVTTVDTITNTVTIAGTVKIDQLTANANEVVVKSISPGSNIIGKVGIDPLVNTIKLDTANNLVKAQGIYNSVLPTIASGSQEELQLDVNGKLIVKIPDAITVNTITGFATSAKQSDGTQLSQVAGIAKGVTPANSATVTVIGTDNNALDVNITKSVVVQTVPMLADGLTTLTNSSILNNAQYVTTLSNKLTQDVSAISIGWDSVGAHHREIAVDSTGQVKVLSAQLPTALGQVAMASSISVAIASNQTAIPTVPSTQAGGVYTAQLTVGLSQVRATVSGAAPVSTRKKLFIKPSSLNTGAIFLIATGGSITTGLEIIGPDRLEFNLDAADYFVISDTTGQKVEVLEVY